MSWQYQKWSQQPTVPQSALFYISRRKSVFNHNWFVWYFTWALPLHHRHIWGIVWLISRILIERSIVCREFRVSEKSFIFSTYLYYFCYFLLDWIFLFFHFLISHFLIFHLLLLFILLIRVSRTLSFLLLMQLLLIDIISLHTWIILLSILASISFSSIVFLLQLRVIHIRFISNLWFFLFFLLRTFLLLSHSV